MAGLNPNTKFINPSDDVNRPRGLETVNVNVLSNMSQIGNRTSERLFQCATESVQTSELILNARNRLSGTPFNFIVDMGAPIYRGRLLQFENAIFPQIENVNRLNNQLNLQFLSVAAITDAIQNNNGSTTIPPGNVNISITTGNYDADAIGNTLQNLITQEVTLQLVGSRYDDSSTIESIDNIVVDFAMNFVQRRFFFSIVITEVTVAPDGGGASIPIVSADGSSLLRFWIDSNCSFITFGENFIPFIATNSITGVVFGNPLTAYEVPAEVFIQQPKRSLTAQMFYSRYVTVSSTLLGYYSFSDSKVDNIGAGGGGGKIVCTIETATPVFNSNTFFSAALRKRIDAPILAVFNPQMKLNQNIDITVRDQFGNLLDDVFPTDNQEGPTFGISVSY